MLWGRSVVLIVSENIICKEWSTNPLSDAIFKLDDLSFLVVVLLNLVVLLALK
jgi:hypothetical protein